MFLKDIGSNKAVYAEYGWKNTGTLFKNHMISYAIQFLKEELDVELDDDGTPKSVTYGVSRIPDKMLLKEMMAYYPGLNVDRLVSFAALVSFAKVQQSNRGYSKRVEKQEENLHKTDNLYKLNMSPFRHVGGSKTKGSRPRPRNPFKNYR